MASTNLLLNPNVDTVFMMTKTEYSYFSSSMVKEIALFKGDISKFVPPSVATKVYQKIGSC
jgi:pantetheine-phosphate adenylyltransferase